MHQTMSICELGKVILFEIKLESLGALSLKEVSFILYSAPLWRQPFAQVEKLTLSFFPIYRVTFLFLKF